MTTDAGTWLDTKRKKKLVPSNDAIKRRHFVEKNNKESTKDNVSTRYVTRTYLPKLNYRSFQIFFEKNSVFPSPVDNSKEKIKKSKKQKKKRFEKQKLRKTRRKDIDSPEIRDFSDNLRTEVGRNRYRFITTGAFNVP